MESISFAQSFTGASPTFAQSQYQLDALIVESSFGNDDDSDAIGGISISSGIGGSLAVSTSDLLKKLNELLAGSTPGGVESLNPADHTAEKTADTIVQGSTAFFDTFAKQNPELEGEELLNAFLDTIKGGIQQGYDDAYSTLEGIGAFEVSGIREGVEQTKVLIEQKLAQWEKSKRVELGIDSVESGSAGMAQNGILQQAGVGLLAVA